MNPGDLNPGIRNTVAWLRSLGFDTTDSGDGRTNVEAGMEGARHHAHVTIATCPSFALVSHARTLRIAVEAAGLCLEPIGAGPCIQATYDPVNDIALLDLMNVDDALLALLGIPLRAPL